MTGRELQGRGVGKRKRKYEQGRRKWGGAKRKTRPEETVRRPQVQGPKKDLEPGRSHGEDVCVSYEGQRHLQ